MRLKQVKTKVYYSWWLQSPRRLASRAFRELPGDCEISGRRSLQGHCERFGAHRSGVDKGIRKRALVPRIKGFLGLWEGHLAILLPCEGEDVAPCELRESKALLGAPNEDYGGVATPRYLGKKITFSSLLFTFRIYILHLLCVFTFLELHAWL